MPQWSRDRSSDTSKYPDERWVARCPRSQAPQLLRYDHHVVWVRGRPALLRTYHWAAQAVEAWPDEMPVEISFTYASGHPTAPAEIQRVVESLSFAPIESADGPSE